MLPSKNIQDSARPGARGSLAVEDVHRNFTSAELNGNLPHFLGGLHGQRTRECKGKEGEEGEESDDESGALHVERVEIERGVRKVVS